MLSRNGKVRNACITSNAVKFTKINVNRGHQENLSVWNYSSVEECLYNAGPAPLGWPGWPWPPHFLAPLQKKNGDIFKPRYVCTSDSSIHLKLLWSACANIRWKFLLILKNKVWFSGHVPMLTQTESAVLQTHSQMQSCSAHGDEVYDHRPSSACMTYVLIHKDPAPPSLLTTTRDSHPGS